MYMVITDRFANGRTDNDMDADLGNVMGYHGGDFAGLTDRLSYLADLGVNTIWLTPIVQQVPSPVGEPPGHWAFHGYWAEHFDRLEPRLGTDEELSQLLGEAHEQNLEVILDVVLNHSGYGSHFASDSSWVRSEATDSCPQSGATDLDRCLYGLPDFRTEDPSVREQLITWQAHWFDAFAFDGLRADTVKHVETSVWLAFLSRLRDLRGNSTLFALGESWGTTPSNPEEPLLGDGLFDAMYDFEFSQQLEGWLNFRMRSEALAHHLQIRNERAANRYVHYLNTHDTPTFVGLLETPEAYPLALALLLTSNGIPLLYYGDELGRPGGEWPHNRPDMPWHLVGEQNELLSLTRSLIEVRGEHPALRSGTFEIVTAVRGLLAVRRSHGQDSIIVALNRGPEAETLRCPSESSCSPILTLNARIEGENALLEPFGAVVIED